MPAAVRVVVLDDAGLLFDDVGAGARARHCRAQEHVDDEHDEKHEPERYAQVQQPRRPDAAVHRVVAQRQAAGRLTGFQNEHRRAGRQRAVLRLTVRRESVPRLAGKKTILRSHVRCLAFNAFKTLLENAGSNSNAVFRGFRENKRIVND